MNKTIILAAFIFPERLEWFLEYIHTKFGIHKDTVFGFEDLSDKSKIIVTFKLTLQGKRINFKEAFPSAVQIHKKGDCLYSINALNKIIESKLGDDIGNVDYQSVKIDWSEYQNQLILTNAGKLMFLPIKRIF
jgi:hypothetical protein